MIKILKNKSFIVYGVALALFLFLLKWLELQFILINYSFEIYTSAIAIAFTFLGIWLALKLVNPKKETVIIEKTVYKDRQEFVLDIDQLDNLGLSKREMEVLDLMAKGLSNQEIAESLFVSLNTIKTHSSKVFEKLDVKRRTQAVEKAKRLNLIH
ncbi:response regulator transcription factor [Aurantibacillus circumpalustris]|uniref:response regulator transcription factor n=1 Tax=Aurantibacillus circumpalustris TaxID=3036359 RepID=UPI00295B87DD|nr:LuxR C-terminal-related transcriptional regulator [Aurantibacillus circumpalustris]